MSTQNELREKFFKEYKYWNDDLLDESLLASINNYWLSILSREIEASKTEMEEEVLKIIQERNHYDAGMAKTTQDDFTIEYHHGAQDACQDIAIKVALINKK